MRPIVVLLGIGAASFGIWKFSHREAPVPQKASVPPPVASAPVAPPAQAPPRGTGFIGVVLAGDWVQVEPNVAGRIEEIFVKPGEQVQRGARICQLDARAAKHALESAQATASEAARRLSRRSHLVTGGLMAITPEEMDNAKFDAVRERANVATLARQVADATVIAPFTGTVTEQYLMPGALAGPGRPILRLLGHAPPRVRFAVPEDMVHNLASEASLVIETPSGDHKGSATLLGLTPEVDNASGMIYGTASIDTGPNTDPQLSKGGLIVRVFPHERQFPHEQQEEALR
jgi:RND family efflux transporter MFP subunit